MRPAEVALSGPFLTDTLGNAETEFAAGLVVLWHRAEGHVDWVPVTRSTIIGWLEQQVAAGREEILRLVRNPFWRPDPDRLRHEGWITGWTTADDPGLFTEKALRCFAQRGLWKTERAAR